MKRRKQRQKLDLDSDTSIAKHGSLTLSSAPADETRRSSTPRLEATSWRAHTSQPVSKAKRQQLVKERKDSNTRREIPITETDLDELDVVLKRKNSMWSREVEIQSTIDGRLSQTLYNVIAESSKVNIENLVVVPAVVANQAVGMARRRSGMWMSLVVMLGRRNVEGVLRSMM
ncbi:hypothetical protein J1614_003730 [Plenodomus biglobosus]|nr:hypothetical protein J1614_003730 [Plenodomus biglobosus]